MNVPLHQIAAGAHRAHDPGPGVGARLSPHVLAECLRTALPEIEQQLPPFPEYASPQPGHGEDDLAVRNGLEHLFAQPLGPEEGALLLAGGAERSSATRVWDQVAQTARSTPSACEAGLDESTCEEARSTRSTTGRSGSCALAKGSSYTRRHSSGAAGRPYFRRRPRAGPDPPSPLHLFLRRKANPHFPVTSPSLRPPHLPS